MATADSVQEREQPGVLRAFIAGALLAVTAGLSQIETALNESR